MRVLFVNTLYYPYQVGGAEKSVQTIAKALVHEGYDVAVATTTPKRNAYCSLHDDVRVHYVPLKNIYWPFGKIRRFLPPIWQAIDIWNPFMERAFSKILDHEKPDIVHTNNLLGFSVAVWRAVKTYKIPIVHTPRDYYLLGRKGSLFSNGKNCDKQCRVCRYYSVHRIRMTRRVDAFVPASEYVSNIHLVHGAFCKTRVRTIIRNPVLPTDSAIRSKRQSTQSHDKIRFGYLGSLAPHKGIELLVSQSKRLGDHQWELLIAGDGGDEYKESLRRMNIDGRISFLGFREPSELLNQVDVLVVPSLWGEPIPRSILESYSMGVPVIASNRGGSPEVVIPGKTGFLFDPNSADSLYNIMQRFIKEPYLAVHMANNAAEYSRKFLPPRIATKWGGLYVSLLSKL